MPLPIVMLKPAIEAIGGVVGAGVLGQQQVQDGVRDLFRVSEFGNAAGMLHMIYRLTAPGVVRN